MWPISGLAIRFLPTKGARGRQEGGEAVVDMLLPVSLVQEQHLIQPLFHTGLAHSSWEWNTRISQAAAPHPHPHQKHLPCRQTPAQRQKFQVSAIPPETCEAASINSNCPSLTGFPKILGYAKPVLFAIPVQACYLGLPLRLHVLFPGLQEFPLLKCWHGFSFMTLHTAETLPENEPEIRSKDIKNVNNDSTTWILYRRKDRITLFLTAGFEV